MFELVELGSGLHTLRDLKTGETFHPVVGPMVEANAIHIDALRLQERLHPQNDFVVWDVGLGAAANAVAFVEALAAHPGAFRCTLMSFDLTIAPLEFALRHSAQLDYLQPWSHQLTELAETGGTQIQFQNGGSLHWQLVLGDFTQLPPAPAPDGVIYDPYSPMKNEAMWSLAHFASLRKQLTRPAVLTSYSRSTAVRVTLLLAGFYVGEGAATGEKEQTTVAATDIGLLDKPLAPAWLRRVRMSTSARPLGTGERGPIGPSELEKLENHPQFQPHSD